MMTELTRKEKIEELTNEWIDRAELDNIIDYAKEKLTEWYEGQDDNWINEFHQEMLDYETSK